VRSEWTKEDGRFTLTVAVPPNSTAEVWVPLLGGRIAHQPHRAEFVRMDGDYALYRVGSGSFTFTTIPR
jgi:alpha-L-rhamnosidase